MSPKIVNKQEKKYAIAHAAGILFGDRGVSRVKMADVAVAAGVGKGTIYEYFKDKEALLDGAFELAMGDIIKRMQGAFDPEAPPVETLKKIARVMAQAMDDFGHGYRFFLEYMLHCGRRDDNFHIFRDIIAEFRRETATLLSVAIERGEIRADIDVESIAAAFAAWFDGAVFHWVVIPEKPSLADMAEAYMDSFLNGVLKRG